LLLLSVDIAFSRRRVVERPRFDDRCFTLLTLEAYVEIR
jgi:hypothetical protein